MATSWTSWLAPSLTRHFPLSPARHSARLQLDIARNEPISFQTGIRQESGNARHYQLTVDAPDDIAVRIRRIGYVPLRHHNTMMAETDIDGKGYVPGYVPDPLFEENEVFIPAGETSAFFITLCPRPGAQAGTRKIRVRIRPETGRSRNHTLSLRVYNLDIAPRKDFFVTNWFYNDALLDFYHCTAFDERYWQILPHYLRNIAEHGQDTVYVPVFTPSLDGIKRPSQLLRIARQGKGYRFDWTDVKRYLDLALECGITRFEWSHLFTQWGVGHPVRIYEGQGVEEKLLWDPEIPATDPIYRTFLAQFLPELHTFLKKNKWIKRSFFHISDEPHGEEHRANYAAARAMVRELAPWMKCMDALSEIEFARDGVVDFPIPSIQTALEFVRDDITCGCYYCCGPRGQFINRLLDTPLNKIRLNGWLFYRWPFQGFLHWGYNYWYRSQTREMIDPFSMQDGDAWKRGWAYGDTFMVYPGEDGPIDSLRWEIFADSLRDYALLQTLDIPHDDPRLRSLRDFERFPRDPNWVVRIRRELLAPYAEDE